MRYRNQELLDRLAAEYVLGTLHGRARRRFERGTGSTRTRAPWYERLGLWRALTLAATAAAVVLAVMLKTTPAPGPQYVAVFSDQKAQPLWVVRADTGRGRPPRELSALPHTPRDSRSASSPRAVHRQERRRDPCCIRQRCWRFRRD